MAIRGKIGTKITINPIYMTNRRFLFGNIVDLVASPGDLTNFTPYFHILISCDMLIYINTLILRCNISIHLNIFTQKNLLSRT